MPVSTSSCERVGSTFSRRRIDVTVEAMIEQPEVAEFLGLTNRFLVTAAQTDGALSVVEITVAPGGGAPLHVNTREDLTWCVIHGTLTFSRGEATHEVGAGQAIFMPKDQLHTFLNRTERPAIGLMVCTPGGFEGFLREMAASGPATADGPPPADAIAAMQEIGSRFGMTVLES
jgi:quercetin dioxygenase-like cupin family protein